MDLNMINVGVGLLGLILINIILGSMSAILQKQFDKIKLFQGIIKGIIVTISFIGCVFIGQLNPDILVISAEGQDVNLVTGINILLITAYIWYGKEVFTKLASFVNAKITGK